MMLLSPPLGVIGGYLMTAIILFKSSWHVSFLIQGLMVLFFACILFILPDQYINIDFV
jgi:hypothetical protein